MIYVASRQVAGPRTKPTGNKTDDSSHRQVPAILQSKKKPTSR